MARVVLTNLALFVLPFLLYAAYIALAGSEEAQKEFWTRLPLLPLFVAGLLLVFVSLAVFATFSEQTAGKAYEPPVVKDGRIEPGRVR
jgi:hypothetical protein